MFKIHGPRLSLPATAISCSEPRWRSGGGRVPVNIPLATGSSWNSGRPR